jgi:methylated-DNA-protein-cysteine methyltransferase-like protein
MSRHTRATRGTKQRCGDLPGQKHRDPFRSPSYVRIWNATRKIPRGRVSTYGVIAVLAGLEGQPRLAGYALHNIVPGADIPWHRVINARGKISLRGDDKLRQRSLLQGEGVLFQRNRVDLAVFGWPRTRYEG